LQRLQLLWCNLQTVKAAQHPRLVPHVLRRHLELSAGDTLQHMCPVLRDARPRPREQV
jgi:hypothetical protein